MYVKNFDDICRQLSVKIELGRPYINSQCVVNASERSHAVIACMETVTVNFVNRSVIPKRNIFSRARF